MPLDEATLKRQLGRANDDLAAWVKALESQGVPAAGRRKDPKWRRLNAACSTLRSRLKTVAAIAARDEEAARRKAEKLAAPAVEKESKKSAKGAKGGAKEKAPAKKGEKGTEAKEKKKKEPAPQ